MLVGKRVRGSRYLHVSAIHLVSVADSDRIRAASGVTRRSWNVVRLAPTDMSLLAYADFETDAFPSLLTSTSIGADAIAIERDYTQRANPPILHRKELLVAPEHPGHAEWAELTSRLERAGAFVHPHRIGTRAAWQERLRELGLSEVWTRPR